MAVETAALPGRRPRWLRGVLGKELRGLAPFTSVLLLSQVLVWVAPTQTAIAWAPGSASLVRGLFLFSAAALYGALFFGLEPPAVRGFLLQLPIPRSTLLAAKAGAAACHMALFWGLSEWLARTVSALPVTPWPGAEGVVGALLAYGVCAWVSVLTRDALAALVCGSVLCGLGYVAGADLIAPAWRPAAGGVVLCAIAWDLWRQLASWEDRTGVGVLVGWRPAGRLRRPRLLTLEWKQKWPVMSLLLVLPVLSSALYLPGAGAFAFFLWVPIAGAVVGVFLFTEPERSGERFFLHHLPIRRRTLVLQRLGFGLAFGALMSFEFGVVLWTSQRHGPVLIPPESVLAALYLVALLYLVTFGLGAALSPWMSSSLLGAALVLLTLLALVFVPSLFELEAPPLGLHALMVTSVLGLAWWSTVHSRALEPAPGKVLRALWLLLPFWALSLWSLFTGGS